MKKSKFILGVVAAIAAVTAITGCEGLQLRDADQRVTESGSAVKSLAVTGAQTSFVVGDNFNANTAVVTATFYDGSTADVTTGAVFATPDISTVGTKTVTVTYAKTSLGEDCTAVSTTYDIEVINRATKVELKSGKVYTLNGGKVAIRQNGAVFTVTFQDGSINDFSASDITFGDVTANGEEYSVLAYYAGYPTEGTLVENVENSDSYETLYNDGVSLADLVAAEVTALELYDLGATTTDLVNAGADIVSCLYKLDGSATGMPLAGFTGSYSATAWWAVLSGNAVEVANGKILQTVFKNNSYGTANWSGPVEVVTDSATTTEYLVARNDNYGWGNGYASATLDRMDIDWDGFPTLISGSTTYASVINYGTTFDLYLHFVKDGSLVYWQAYKGVAGPTEAGSVYLRLMGDAGADITYCE